MGGPCRGSHWGALRQAQQVQSHGGSEGLGDHPSAEGPWPVPRLSWIDWPAGENPDSWPTTGGHARAPRCGDCSLGSLHQ